MPRPWADLSGDDTGAKSPVSSLRGSNRKPVDSQTKCDTAMSGVAMGTRYSHLTLEERCRLRGLMEIGLRISEIARRLGRHRATIHREIRRNRCFAGYR